MPADPIYPRFFPLAFQQKFYVHLLENHFHTKDDHDHVHDLLAELPPWSKDPADRFAGAVIALIWRRAQPYDRLRQNLLKDLLNHGVNPNVLVCYPQDEHRIETHRQSVERRRRSNLKIRQRDDRHVQRVPLLHLVLDRADPVALDVLMQAGSTPNAHPAHTIDPFSRLLAAKRPLDKYSLAFPKDKLACWQAMQQRGWEPSPEFLDQGWINEMHYSTPDLLLNVLFSSPRLDLHAVDAQGCNVLHKAVKMESTSRDRWVPWLLDQGVDFSARDHQNHTPLSRLLDWDGGRASVARTLLEARELLQISTTASSTIVSPASSSSWRPRL